MFSFSGIYCIIGSILLACPHDTGEVRMFSAVLVLIPVAAELRQWGKRELHPDIGMVLDTSIDPSYP